MVFSLLGSVFSQCHNKYERLLLKGDTVKVKCNEMVIMNIPTYSKYYKKAYLLHELQKRLPKDSLLLDSLQDIHKATMDSLLANKESFKRIVKEKDSVRSILEKDVSLCENSLNSIAYKHFRLQQKHYYIKRGFAISTCLVILESIFLYAYIKKT
jgi:hypothetical protein